MASVISSSDFQQGTKVFLDVLKAQANAAVDSKYQGKVLPVEFSGTGDFNYIWENQTHQVNALTYDFITRRVGPGTANGVKLLDSFPTAFNTLIVNTAYTLSNADLVLINQANKDAEIQALSVVNIYEGNLTKITPEALARATQELGWSDLIPMQPIDYVEVYACGYVWSGRKQKGLQPLTLKEMAEARSLVDLLPMLPPSGVPVIGAVVNHLNMKTKALPLEDMRNLGNFILAQLKRNFINPTAQNGGITTDDAQVHVGYTIKPSVAEIQNALTAKNPQDPKKPTKEIVIKMNATRTTQDVVDLHVEGQAGISLPIGWFRIGNSAHVEYNLFDIKGTSQQVSIEMHYPNPNMVSVAPTTWASDNPAFGWYYPQPLLEANQNGKQDVTGFRFGAQVPYNLAKNGDFGLLTGILISQFPTIDMVFKQASYESLREEFAETTRHDIRFLGIKIGSFSQSFYKSRVEQTGVAGEVRIHFEPDPEIFGVAPRDQKAYVIGAIVNYPAVEK